MKTALCEQYTKARKAQRREKKRHQQSCAQNHGGGPAAIRRESYRNSKGSLGALAEYAGQAGLRLQDAHDRALPIATWVI